MSSPNVVQTAKEYYNSKDADEFYYAIWGGEDIHVGLYDPADSPILEASRRTVERMASRLSNVGPDTRIIDLGAGYGGAARFLVNKFGCHVTCLNLSEVQNDRNREANQAAGLEDRIDVIDGAFESVDAADEAFDVAWSEDAFLHSPDRKGVLKEVFRILKPGGDLVFTDPMQKADVPPGALQPVYDRIHLDSLASFEFYKEAAKDIGFELVEIEDLSPHLAYHYDRVRQDLEARYDEIVELSSREYVDRMLAGLGHWVDGGRAGHLTWGILHFRKP